ncbi:MAG TPA: RNA polymerase sigma factor [Candidatus Paceibacterota bacterium]|nr:RNA polymerase sigma factor [Candidatus Paceibacterota bacterium]
MLLLEDRDLNIDYKDHKDEEVLALSIANPNIFGVIVERYEEAFLRKAKSIIGYDIDEVNDIVQETFTKIYLNAHKFRPVPGASFKSWAYRILLNVTFTWYGKLKKGREAVMRLDPELDEVIPDKKASSEFERETTKDYVISVLVRMPDSFAKVLRSYFIEGKSHKEIAKEEGVSVEAIKTRMCRAKKEFKKIECNI